MFPTSSWRRRKDHETLGERSFEVRSVESGVMWQRQVWTRRVVPNYDGKFLNLGDELVPRR